MLFLYRNIHSSVTLIWTNFDGNVIYPICKKEVAAHCSEAYIKGVRGNWNILQSLAQWRNKTICPTSERAIIEKGNYCLSVKCERVSDIAKFVNCSYAAPIKVYWLWQNGTKQNQRWGKWGALRAIDNRNERLRSDERTHMCSGK